MAKEKTVYVCSNCGQESPKWVGKCPSCGEWNTYVEEVIRKEVVNKRPVSGIETEKPKPIVLSEIEADDEPRIDLHDEELNRVLGGGLVPGSLVLIGGEPGIGKSTLVLQTVLHIPEKRVLYVSGEESARQLKLRADRLSHLLPLLPGWQDKSQTPHVPFFLRSYGLWWKRSAHALQEFPYNRQGKVHRSVCSRLHQPR